MDKSDENSQNKDDPDFLKLRAVMIPFLRSYLTYQDFQKALKIVEEQARLVWEKHFIAELKRLGLDIKVIENTFLKSSKIMASLMDKRASTKPYIQIAQLYGDGENKTISFAQWRSKDKVIVVVSLTSALVVLFMGAANVYANIMGSGNPTFIENSYLAVIISMLLPAGAVAMKFVTDIFESDKTKARYVKTLNILTVVAMLAWTVLFAQTFDGQSAGIDLDEMLKANPASSMLTWIQLLAELLVGFVLCQTASDTHAKYAQNSYIRNPERTEIEAVLEEHSDSHEALRDDLNSRTGREAELNAGCQIFVNEMVALFLNMRGRFDDSAPQ